MMRTLVFLILNLIFCITAFAQLVVVSTDGSTVSSHKYLRAIHYPNKKDVIKRLQQEKGKTNVNTVLVKSQLYPIRSQLTVGIVKSTRITTPNLMRPIFVMGDDAFSIKWAKTNASDLKKMGAVGFITNVESQDRVNKIEDETGLTLFPAQLSGLSEHLPITHYPFLWTKGGIEQ